MKKSLVLLASCALVGGCAHATRVLTDTATAGAGGLAAHQLSKGNPAVTVAGAGAGLLLGEGIHVAHQAAAAQAYSKGFDKGRSDAVKQQYWIMVHQQRGEDFAEETSLFDLPLPEHERGGAIINPSIRSVRIDE